MITIKRVKYKYGNAWDIKSLGIAIRCFSVDELHKAIDDILKNEWSCK